MAYLSLRQRIIWPLLGQQAVSAELPEYLSGSSGFVQTESKRVGFRFSKSDGHIVVKRVDPWATAMGIPPLYYFRGRVEESGAGGMLNGTVVMSAVPKVFILVWVTFLAFGLLAFTIYAIRLLSAGSTEQAQLVGSMVGVGIGTAAFGALVIILIRWITARQRRKLISFCSGASAKAV